MQINSASMLITDGGYCVKVHRPKGQPIVFFVDKEFNHRIWKLTLKKPWILLDQREFWRMRREWKCEETLLTTEQTIKAIEIAEKIDADPYYGFPMQWRKQNNLMNVKEIKDQLRRKNEKQMQFKASPKSSTKMGEIPGLTDAFKNLPGKSPIEKFNRRYPKKKTA